MLLEQSASSQDSPIKKQPGGDEDTELVQTTDASPDEEPLLDMETLMQPDMSNKRVGTAHFELAHNPARYFVL